MQDTTTLGTVINLLGMAIKVGRYLPIIVVSFAVLNLLLAVNDLLISKTGFWVLNSIFALGSFIFLVQLHQRRKIHSYEYDYDYKKRIDNGRAMTCEIKESENIW
jgi:hypothetical protein